MLQSILNLTIKRIEKNHDISLVFENETVLTIFNNCKTSKELSVSLNLRIEKIDEYTNHLILHFTDGTDLVIDLSNDAYNGPEALLLSIPGSPPIVWN